MMAQIQTFKRSRSDLFEALFRPYFFKPWLCTLRPAQNLVYVIIYTNQSSFLEFWRVKVRYLLINLLSSLLLIIFLLVVIHVESHTVFMTSPSPLQAWSQSSPSQSIRLWVMSLAVILHHWSMCPDGTILLKNFRRDLVANLLTLRERLDESSTLIIPTYPKFNYLSHSSLIGGYISENPAW